MPNNYKLGKLAPKIDNRTLKMANYIKKLPPIPAAINWYSTPELQQNFSWGMLLNDQMGCCAIAGPAHIEMVWTGNTGHPYIATNDCVLKAYEVVGGYNPADSQNTDNGCVMLNVMNYWRNVGICDHKIAGYVSVNPHNITNIKAAIYMFGAINLGIALPASAQDQDIWDVTDPSLTGDATPGSWGGHCVVASKYDANTITCITWGEEKIMTWAYFKTYCDEAYAAISHDWLNANGLSPSGFNLATLQQDLSAIK